MTNPVTEAWIRQQADQTRARDRAQAKALADARFQKRLVFTKHIVLRLVIGGLAAAGAYAVFPGLHVFDKAIASLTLTDIGALVITVCLAIGSFRVLLWD